jgi:hypothetical protein
VIELVALQKIVALVGEPANKGYRLLVSFQAVVDCLHAHSRDSLGFVEAQGEPVEFDFLLARSQELRGYLVAPQGGRV